MTSRTEQLELLGNNVFDVLILGGGISGVAAAHVLTARGYRTALIDNNDFASGTSQESSQLIWGGIKYLENRHVKLVRDLCKDRNQLVARYPERITPMPFLYPHYEHDPHALMTLLLGAYLYWTLGNGFGDRPRKLSAARFRETVPLMRTDDFKAGFRYFDSRMVDSDARLTLDFLFDAMAAGLTAVNYAGFSNLRWNDAAHSYDLKVDDLSQAGSTSVDARARWIVNTTGIWADEVNTRLGVKPPHRHLFSKGIHIITPRIEQHGHALTCLAKDKRPFFVIPWGEVTLIGTTDTHFDEPPRRVTADADDVAYLHRECEVKFNLKLADHEIISTKAGLRPLLAPPPGKEEDFLALARSHKVWSDPRARITSMWGGKYTSAFSMAREIADTVTLSPSCAAKSFDPLPRTEALRTWTGAELLRGGITKDALTEACRRELVVTAEDLLRRRTNIALKSGIKELPEQFSETLRS